MRHDEEERKTGITRRGVLAGIATLGAAGLVAADSSDGSVDLGGNAAESAAASFGYGSWSFAPSTLPPDVADGIGWLRRDTGSASLEFESEIALPHTWTSSGLQWSIGATLSEAENAVSSYPAIAFAEPGGAVLLYDEQIPITWDSNGVRHVIAQSLEQAEELRENNTPAVLWSTDGRAEVVLDA